VRLPTPRRLVLRLLPPIARRFHDRLKLTTLSRLLGKHTLEPLRRSLLLDRR
jgi:hypothetical protein